MSSKQPKYYPGTLDAIHLIVLYVFLQTLIDFPLALYDYDHDTNLLSNPWINFFSGFSITAFIFIFGFRKSKSKFADVFALKLFNPLLIIPIIIFFPGLQFLIGLLNLAIEKIIPSPPWFWELFEKIFENRFGFWGAFFKVAILAPVIEETLFRGIIMHGLMRNYKASYAIFLSGILFSFFHLNPWQMSYTFFLGLFLGWLMIRTRSLPLCIIAHSLNNIIVLLSITYHVEISQLSISKMGTLQSLILSLGAIIISVVLIVIFSRNTKRLTSQ